MSVPHVTGPRAPMPWAAGLLAEDGPRCGAATRTRETARRVRRVSPVVSIVLAHLQTLNEETACGARVMEAELAALEQQCTSKQAHLERLEASLVGLEDEAARAALAFRESKARADALRWEYCERAHSQSEQE